MVARFAVTVSGSSLARLSIVVYLRGVGVESRTQRFMATASLKVGVTFIFSKQLKVWATAKLVLKSWS